jgi:hypothetical protein
MFWKIYTSILTCILLFFLFSFFRFERVGDKIYRCRWTNTIYLVDGGFVTLEESMQSALKMLKNKAPE